MQHIDERLLTAPPQCRPLLSLAEYTPSLLTSHAESGRETPVRISDSTSRIREIGSQIGSLASITEKSEIPTEMSPPDSPSD